jgi:hypothetical protein
MLTDKGAHEHASCIDITHPHWCIWVSDDLEQQVQEDWANKLGGVTDELQEGNIKDNHSLSQ